MLSLGRHYKPPAVCEERLAAEHRKAVFPHHITELSFIMVDGKGLLAGKSILVTGASKGIGAAIAEKYASEGKPLRM